MVPQSKKKQTKLVTECTNSTINRLRAEKWAFEAQEANNIRYQLRRLHPNLQRSLHAHVAKIVHIMEWDAITTPKLTMEFNKTLASENLTLARARGLRRLK